MTERFDAIVVGAGHNGLVCASLLAKAGKSVLVLEANEQVGGAAITRSLPRLFRVGLRAPALPAAAGVQKELKLNVELAADNLPTVVLAEDGHHVRYIGDEVHGVSARTPRVFARLFAHEALRRAAATAPEQRAAASRHEQQTRPCRAWPARCRHQAAGKSRDARISALDRDEHSR